MRSLCPTILLFLVTVSVLPGWSAGSISCDFEDGDCGWKSGENETLHWRIERLRLDNSYIGVDASSSQVNDTATLFSPWLNGSTSQTCQLQFGFFKLSDNFSTELSVYLRTETELTKLWSFTDKLIYAELSPKIEVPCTKPRYQIVFEGKKTVEGSWSMIGIDDIDYKQFDLNATDGSETSTKKDDAVSCGFKYGLCGWTTGGAPIIRTGPYFSFGDYMEMKLDDSYKGTLSSPWLAGSANRKCQLQFGYLESTYRSSVLVVVSVKTETKTTELWRTPGTEFTVSQLSPKINVPCSEPRYQIVIEGRKVASEGKTYSRVFIEDISYKETFSTTTQESRAAWIIDTNGSCGFRYGDCGWTSVSSDAYKWKMLTSFFTNYFWVDMENAAINDTGTLASPWLNGSANQTCQLRFGFFLHTGRSIGQLSVLLKTETNVTELWTTTGKSNVLLNEYSPKIDVPCTEPRYQILFEGKHVGLKPKFMVIKFIDYRQRYYGTITEGLETPTTSGTTDAMDISTASTITTVTKPADVTETTTISTLTEVSDVTETSTISTMTEVAGVTEATSNTITTYVSNTSQTQGTSGTKSSTGLSARLAMSVALLVMWSLWER